MRVILLLVAPLVALIAGCGDGASPTSTPSAATTSCPPPADAPTESITFSGQSGSPVLLLEIADTTSERAKGLSNRDCLAANAGMLFAWPTDTTTGFWMKDTHIPLSIAFIRSDETSPCGEGDNCGVIVSIQDMQPESTDNHSSPEAFRYAVEANQGWFEEHEVSVGGAVAIPDLISRGATN